MTRQGGEEGLTFGAETSGDVGFGRGDVGQTQRPLVKVLVGEEVSQADVGRLLCDVHAELLQGDGRAQLLLKVCLKVSILLAC